MKIQPIVEGHGDVNALPVLLRRLIAEAQAWNIEVGRPIRINRDKLVKKIELERAVSLAIRQPACSSVLVLFDGDSDCPAELAPILQEWATSVARDVPCQIVVSQREYEAWFLAAIESLRGKRRIRNDATPHQDPEAPRGAKAQLEARMFAGSSYSETTDQPALSALFSLQDAYRGCRSFRKLTSAFGQLVRSMGQEIGEWPPANWIEGS